MKPIRAWMVVDDLRRAAEFLRALLRFWYLRRLSWYISSARADWEGASVFLSNSRADVWGCAIGLGKTLEAAFIHAVTQTWQQGRKEIEAAMRREREHQRRWNKFYRLCKRMRAKERRREMKTK